MRRLFRFPQRMLAAAGGAAIAFLTVGPVQAQYYPYAPYPGYPMVASVYVPRIQSPPAVMPVSALTGDYRSWGWGKSRDCAPPCPAPEVAPAPAPQPAPAPEMKAAPEPVRPPQPPPAPVEPPVVLQPSEVEQGPALGSGSFALATPGMIGDFLGGCSVRPVTVTASVNTFNFANTPFPEPLGTGTSAVNLLVAIPDFSRGAFKIAENESPIPRDRVFAYANHYVGVLAVVQNGTLSPNFNDNGPGAGNPFPPPTFSVNKLRFDVYREVIGFEKTFFDGRASVEVRAPFFQTNGNIPFSATGTSSSMPIPGDINTLTADVNSSVDLGSGFGDMTVVLKYAPYLNRSTGNVIATGVAITIPTGPSIPTNNGNGNCFVFQPYVGWLWVPCPNWYVQGFSSVAVPTNSDTDTLLFNDVGVGYWLYRSNTVLSGIVPTVELHSDVALNDHDCTGYPTKQVDITGGVHTIFNNHAIVTLGVSIPVTGPTPYTVEGQIELNYQF